MEGVDRERYDVAVCCLATIAGNRLQEELERAGVAFENLGARSLRDAGAFFRLVRLIRRGRFDLVHAHLTYASIWGAVASKLTGVPMLATLHVAPPAEKGPAKLRDGLMRAVLDRWSAGVIVVSEALRAAYLGTGSFSRARLQVVHNGIDVSAFQGERDAARAFVEREFRIPSGARIAVSVAVLRPGKGIDVLLRAIPSVVEREPAACFLIVGDGEMRDEWSRVAEREGVADHVRWAGHRRDVAAILAGCDLFVHPTLADAFPTVLLEAMAAGLPVVASDVGGIPEIVEEGITGTLVPPNHVARLASAVVALLAYPAESRQAGRAAREIARHRFSTDAWVQRLSAVYDEVWTAAEQRG